jgi:hypothetical protein
MGRRAAGAWGRATNLKINCIFFMLPLGYEKGNYFAAS